MMGKAKRALDSYVRQTLENVYDDIGISRYGADLQTEQAQLAMGTGFDAIQQAGTRGVIGGAGRVLARNNDMMRQIGADLDMQENRRRQMAAQDNARIRQMQERREEMDLAGLGQQMNIGRQDMWSGIGDIANAGMFAGQTGAFDGLFRGKAKPIESSIETAGYQYSQPEINAPTMPQQFYKSPYGPVMQQPQFRGVLGVPENYI
jgi:hypothetical protein